MASERPGGMGGAALAGVNERTCQYGESTPLGSAKSSSSSLAAQEVRKRSQAAELREHTRLGWSHRRRNLLLAAVMS